MARNKAADHKKKKKTGKPTETATQQVYMYNASWHDTKASC
jgi:hypothetical protein